MDKGEGDALFLAARPALAVGSSAGRAPRKKRVLPPLNYGLLKIRGQHEILITALCADIFFRPFGVLL